MAKKATKKTAAKKTAKKVTSKTAKKETAKKAVKKSEKTKEEAKPSSAATNKKTTAKKTAKTEKPVEATIEKKPADKKPSRKKQKKEVIKFPAENVKRCGLKLAPGVLISGKKKEAETACCAKPSEPQEYRKLSKKELADVKEKLIEMRNKIVESLRKEFADVRQRASQISPDLVDQASDACDEDISMEIAATSDEELEQIAAALEKLQKNTYGLCEMCGTTISPTRLKILPFATRCVSCRGTYERTRRRRDGSNSWAFVSSDSSPDEENE